MKKGQLGRADLLTAIIKQDQQAQEVIAEALGLVYLEDASEENRQKPSGTTASNQQEKPETRELNRSPTATLSTQYWQLVKYKNINKEEKPADQPKKVVQENIWRNRPDPYPDYPALTSLKDLRSRLFSVLHGQFHGRYHIDIPALINKLSRAEFVDKIPQKQQQQNLHSLQIIDDRQLYLTPFWLDHVWVTMHLYDEFSCFQINRAVLQNGEEWPQVIGDHARLEAYQPPTAGTPVLILSDLGRLAPKGTDRIEHFSHRQKQYWRLIQKILENGNPVTVLTPCHPKDYPFVMRQQIEFVPWEEHSTPLSSLQPCKKSKTDVEDSVSAWIELLRILVAPAIRLEPQVLRSLRLGLRQYDYQIPAAVEALFWQHPDIKEPHNIAATLEPESNKRYRKKITKQRKELQAHALRTIKQWRGDLPPEIWFEEIIGMEDLVELTSIFNADEALEYIQDIEDGLDFLQQIINHGKLQGDKGDAYRAWLTRFETRICDSAVQTGKGNRVIQAVLSLLSPGKSQTPSGHVIDPNLLEPTTEHKQAVWLCQYGNQLAVSLYNPSQVPGQNTSIIAPIEYRNPDSKVLLADGTSYSIDLPSQGLINSSVLSLTGAEKFPRKGMFTLKTDNTELLLQAVGKPSWAVGMGRDAHGLFVDMEIAKNKSGESLYQRFRWIAAGEFMMGSPRGEVDRYDDEDYHMVTLTRGYWLADTAVTQEVWQAVTGKNPSRFKGDLRPVEQVSWDDAQGFIERLNRKFESHLSDLFIRLPTEAEWEHACRAGTDTPFSFGKNITPDQVNYNGDLPYADGKKGKFRNKTVPVKSLPANAWGLYEMHGNVWELCADGWQEHLGKKDVVDPYKEEGSDRVVRGGSWDGYGGHVRSASRLHDSPDYRIDGIGFRLALGHELKSR